MKDFAKIHQKPYALTETGNTHPENPKWWTEVLQKGIEDSGISWFLLWRNARPSHYFATYPGELSSENFNLKGIKFRRNYGKSIIDTNR